MWNNISTISYYTFKEIIKSKVLVNVLILGLLQLLVTYIAYSFTYGEPSRVALDFGIGTLNLSAIGIAIFMGVGLLSDEIENRTVYMIISRPVSRSSFILGRLLGLLSILIVNIVTLSVISLLLYFITGGDFQPLILWTIFATLLESMIVLIIVSLLSMLTSKTLSVLLTILIYILGNAIDAAKLLEFVKIRPLLGHILDAYHFLLPGFYKFNFKPYLLYKQSLSIEYLTTSIGYGLLYAIGLVFLSLYVFNKKDLD